MQSKKCKKLTQRASLDLDAWPTLSAFAGLSYSLLGGEDYKENSSRDLKS